ncbi:MAG TPA: LytTR family DNA-binding domain-containing protein [Bacteroidia bacterium]|nr:LytTR family DNA-binding domain-containing protein [Bacteroidia bacterium]
MKCIIVDDTAMAREMLKDLLSSYDEIELVAECSDTFQAKKILGEKKIDLMLLDVEMPKVSGLEFLRSLENPPLTILITAREHYAVEAFEHNVVDYLVKPVNESRFMKAIGRAQELFRDRDKTVAGADKEYIFIKDKGVLTKVLFSDILFIKALGDYVTIHTPGKQYTIHVNMRSIEERLPADKFFRLHRSYIVALDKVDTIEQDTVFVQKNAIPIGEAQKPAMLARLNLL